MAAKILFAAAVFTVFSAWGCGGAGMERTGGIEAPGQGLRMNAPSGWRVHGPDSALVCSKNSSTGIILVEPLEGRVFGEYVRELSEDFGGKVISSAPISVSGYDAVRAVVEHPAAGSKSLHVYIHKGDELIQISFTAPAEDFPGYESSLNDSVASIRIK